MYEVSYMWYSAVACFVVVIIGVAVGAVINARGRKTKSEPMNRDLYAPVIETLLACWPKKLRLLLREKKLVSSRKMTPEETAGMEEDILRSFLEEGKGHKKGQILDETNVEAISKRRKAVETALEKENELTEL